MYIYSCGICPLCFDRTDVRFYGLDYLIRFKCKDCSFGGSCVSEDDVPDGVWYTHTKRDLNDRGSYV